LSEHRFYRIRTPRTTLQVSPRLLALVPAAVAINLVVGQLASELSLPVYLDTLGTMLVAVLVGLSGGLLVGTVSQLLSGMLRGYVWIAFTPIQWMVAALVVVAARNAGFATLVRSGLWGAASGIVCGATSSVISYALYGGVTATGVTAVGALFRSVGFTLPVAVTMASIVTDIPDKAASFIVIGILLRSLPRRILGRFPLAARAVGR
jgi:energy-coupling factor transport system substrate-specific component